MTGVKRFFGKLFKFIKESVWLQPVLIVGLIFVFIFSLGGISDFFSNVGNWFQGGETNNGEKLKLEVLTQEEVLNKLLDGEEFVVVFVQDNCAYCEEYYVSLNQYKKSLDDDSSFNGGVKIYAMDVTKVNDEYRDDTILEDTYKEWYERMFDATGEDKWNTKTGFSTPTTVYIGDNEILHAEEGPVKYSQLVTNVSFYFE